MSKVQKNEPKKIRLIQTPVFLILSFCLFFLFTFGSLLIDSQMHRVTDFFCHYITGDLMIQNNKNRSPISFFMPDLKLPKEELLAIDDYSKVQNYLQDNERISVFTPYSLYPANIINTSKGNIPILLKVIETSSFIKEFPKIQLTPAYETSITDEDGMFLPSDLITNIGKLYNTDILVENFLLIADEKTSLHSIRETHFSGSVKYENYSSLFSSIAYIDSDSFPLSIAFDEPEKSNDTQTKLPFPGTETFYSNFITTEPRIKKEDLPDRYFFEFFVNKREPEIKETYPANKWQYIAVSAGKKNNVHQLKNELKKQFYEDDIPLTVLTRDEIADPVQKTIFMNRIFLYFISSIMLIILFILFTLTVRTHARILKNDISLFQKTLISLNLKAIIISTVGICISVFIIPVINEAHISIGNDLLSMLFAGGSILFIAISIQPIFVSIIVLLICIGIINIYPLSLLNGMQQHQHKNT